MRKLLCLALLLVTIHQGTRAQTVAVSGRIVDSSGTGIANVSVTIRGTKTGVATNGDGHFSLTVQKNQTLLATAVGYETTFFQPGAGLLLKLQPKAASMQEVVVTALGIRKEKKALGYAVSVVDKKLLEQRSDGDISHLLSGKAPGVDVLATSGISGSGTNIQIRGASSITGNTDPLWVVDGTPINGSTNQQTSYIYGNQTGSRFTDIDPNNVESISILKGLSATVLYGEAGRNGVILVTTKNGAGKKSNKKLEVTVSQSYFVSQPSSLPELQDTYGGGFSLTGGFSFFSNWGPKFTNPYQRFPHPYGQGVLASAFPDLINDTIEFRPHDNFGAFFNNGHVLNSSVNVSAALGSNGSVNASFGSLTDQGFLVTNTVQRTNFGLGFNTKLLNKIALSATMNYIINDFQSPSTSEAGSSGSTSGGIGVYADLLYTPRANDLGAWPYQTPDGGSAYYRANNDIPNPMWTLHNALNQQNTNRTYGNFTVKFPLFKNADLTYRAGYDFYSEDHILTLNKGGVSSSGELAYTKGIYRTIDVHNRIWDHSLIAQYQAALSPSLKLDITAGVNSNQQLYDQTGLKSTEQLVYGLFSHANFINHDTRAEDGTPMDFRSDQQTLGVYAQAGLSYKDYLFLNAGARNSWASTLEKAHRSELYPSASISFIPTALVQVLKGSTLLNYLKLRAGYATSANYPSPYQTRASLIVATNEFVTRSGAVVNTNHINNTLANPNLLPELLGEFETGAEAKLFSSRVSVDFTWYRRKSTDQILLRPLDPATGYEETTINAGNLINKGIELGLGVSIVRARVFNWQLDVNFTRNRSVVEGLPAAIPQVQTGGLFSNIGNYAINGEPFGVMKGNYWQRDPKSGQRVVGPDGYYIQSTDTKIIGDPNPDYRLSAINTVGYKSFELRVQWDYSKGGDVYATSINAIIARGLAKSTDLDRSLPVVLPGVKQDGTPNDIQTAMDRAFFNTYTGASEQFLYKATFVRLRELSLSYALPATLLGKLPVGGLSLTISAQNLFCHAFDFPKGSNYDPESSSGGVSKTRGFEYMTGPQSRRAGASLRVSF